MLLKGSFEDFFYILIGVIWIAFSIYQGQKKRKQKTTSSPTAEKKKSFFESLLDEFTEKSQQFEETYEDDIKPELAPIEAVENTFEKKFSYDDYYEERNYEEAEEALSDNESFEKSTFNQQLKPVQRKKRKPRFDLRKAVIYSEILKPRYF